MYFQCEARSFFALAPQNDSTDEFFRSPARSPRPSSPLMGNGTGKDAGIWGQVAYYTSLGIIIPAGAVAGLIVGWLVDSKLFHSDPAGTVIGGILGAAGGVYEVVRLLNRAQAQQDGKQ